MRRQRRATGRNQSHAWLIRTEAERASTRRISPQVPPGAWDMHPPAGIGPDSLTALTERRRPRGKSGR